MSKTGINIGVQLSGIYSSRRAQKLFSLKTSNQTDKQWYFLKPLAGQPSADPYDMCAILPLSIWSKMCVPVLVPITPTGTSTPFALHIYVFSVNAMSISCCILHYFCMWNVELVIHGLSERGHKPSCRSGVEGLRDTPSWHSSRPRLTIYPSINGGIQILSSPKHSYCNYKLKPWPRKKLPSAIVPHWSRVSRSDPNLSLFTSHNSDMPEYTVKWL